MTVENQIQNWVKFGPRSCWMTPFIWKVWLDYWCMFANRKVWFFYLPINKLYLIGRYFLNSNAWFLIANTSYLSALDFWHSPVWNFKFDELDFFPILNWMFTACVTCKNPVQTRKRIQFIKLKISNWRMSKINCR